MIEQEVLIQLSEDPFDTERIKILVPKGTKLMTNKAYTKELLKTYLSHEIDKPFNVIDAKQTEGTVHATVENIIFKNDIATEALVNIDSKFTATCSLSKEPKSIATELMAGMSIDIKVKMNKKGEVIASIGDAINEVKIREILESVGDKTVAFKCIVEELIHGGYWVNISGIRCFMPGSLAGLNKLYDFDKIVKTEIIVMPITYSEEKESIVVSHREYLSTLVADTIDDLRENIKEPKIGFVTGTTSFGIFVEFDKCLTGLIPLDEIDVETAELFKNRAIKPGDELKFWPKDIISNKKIILSQKGPVVDFWDNVSEMYKPMMNVKCTVKKLTKYGAFVELDKGIIGLLHKSNLGDTVVNRGDILDVRIKYVNVKDRKISLTLV